jgi:hypothetical protein
VLFCSIATPGILNSWDVVRFDTAGGAGRDLLMERYGIGGDPLRVSIQFGLFVANVQNNQEDGAFVIQTPLSTTLADFDAHGIPHALAAKERAVFWSRIVRRLGIAGSLSAVVALVIVLLVAWCRVAAARTLRIARVAIAVALVIDAATLVLWMGSGRVYEVDTYSEGQAPPATISYSVPFVAILLVGFYGGLSFAYWRLLRQRQRHAALSRNAPGGAYNGLGGDVELV